MSFMVTATDMFTMANKGHRATHTYEGSAWGKHTAFAALVTLLSGMVLATPSYAAIMKATYEGVARFNDGAGIFGPISSSTAQSSYKAVFIYDTTIGRGTGCTCATKIDSVYGGPIFDNNPDVPSASALSPIQYAVLTINNIEYQYNTAAAGEIFVNTTTAGANVVSNNSVGGMSMRTPAVQTGIPASIETAFSLLFVLPENLPVALLNGEFSINGTFGRFWISSLVVEPGNLNAVPVPAALPLFATALGGLAWLSWRRRNDGKLSSANSF